MMEKIEGFSHRGKFLKVIGNYAGNGEPLKIAAAAEINDQKNAQGITGDYITGEDKGAGDDIEEAVMLNRLPDPERDGNNVRENERGEAEEEGNGHLTDDHIPNRHVINIRKAEIEMEELAEPDEVADVDGLVEAKVGLDIGDFLGRDGALACAVNAGCGPEARDDLLDGSAGDELTKEKADKGYPKHRRDHQEKTPDDVSGHWP
jgi:hypothetical protein